jgi:hypothetical protein
MAICADVERQAERGVLAGVDRSLERLQRALDIVGPSLLRLAGPATPAASRLARTS